MLPTEEPDPLPRRAGRTPDIIFGVLGETAAVRFHRFFWFPAYAIWNGIGILASGILVARRREGAKRTLIVNLCCFAGFALLRIWFQFADVSFS